MAGNIRELGENRWYVRVTTGYDEAGKRTVHSKVIHGSKKDAQKYARGVQVKVDSGTWCEATRQTLRQYLDQWIETSARPRLRPRTVEGYEDMIRLYIGPHLGTLRLERVTPLAVQKWVNGMSARGLSSHTVARAHTVLQAALRQAVRWRLIPHNPASEVDLPKRKRVKEPTPVDLEMAAAFLARAREHPHGAAVIFALSTGMRPGEYLAMAWSDIDLEARTVTVRRGLVWSRKKGGGWWFDEAKTAAGRRTVSLPPGLVPVLRTHRARQAEARLALGPAWQDHDLVFPRDDGSPWRQGGFGEQVTKKVLRAAGLPETIRTYDLRHACATILAQRGTSPKWVADQLGHASVRTTLDVYTHGTSGTAEAVAATLDSALFQAPNDAAGPS